MKHLFLVVLLFLGFANPAYTQSFNFQGTGQRVVWVSSTVNTITPSVTLQILEASLNNTAQSYTIKRRLLNTTAWATIATNVAAGTTTYVDNNVALGEIWEYQVRRTNTWTYDGTTFDAIGYTIGALLPDKTAYQGQMILLVSKDVADQLPTKFLRLQKELTASGWYVNTLLVPRASNWDSGDSVVIIRNLIRNIYNAAPSSDKPKCLFIVGHVPLPRSGSTSIVAPDEHDENKGARGFDGYYADLDGVYTDTATYNPGALQTPFAINLPNDFKWDQDFFKSDIEMGFGRIDFADITDNNTPEMQLIEQYLDRLSSYKNASVDMGNKSGFYFGYDNSNDGSFRSLYNISVPSNVLEKPSIGTHPNFVKNNGPFKIYMQNITTPEYSEWVTDGMDATVFSSDQSYWGFGDVPQMGTIYSRIRSLLAVNSKCLVTLWTTTGINIFHQACTGMPFGLSVKEIINHNQTNQLLEKASQSYDTPDWWNRTHLAYYGDPTIQLYQTKPVGQLAIKEFEGQAVLRWEKSTDSLLVGYHVYSSTNELGSYTKLTNSIMLDTNFVILNYQPNNWYMVKAIKKETSGCGQFLHASIGKTITSSLVLNGTSHANSGFLMYPNPANKYVVLEAPQTIEKYTITNCLGEIILQNNNVYLNSVKVETAALPTGVYIVGCIIGKSIRNMQLVIQ